MPAAGEGLASVVAAGAAVATDGGVAVGTNSATGVDAGVGIAASVGAKTGAAVPVGVAAAAAVAVASAAGLLGWSTDADGYSRLLTGGECSLRCLGRSAGRGDGCGRRGKYRLFRRAWKMDIESTGTKIRRGGQEDGQCGDAHEQPPGRVPLVARQHTGDGESAGTWSFGGIRWYANDPVGRFDWSPIGLISFSRRRVRILVEIVGRADETVALDERIGLFVPEATEAGRRGRPLAPAPDPTTHPARCGERRWGRA